MVEHLVLEVAQASRVCDEIGVRVGRVGGDIQFLLHVSIDLGQAQHLADVAERVLGLQRVYALLESVLVVDAHETVYCAYVGNEQPVVDQ